MEIAFTVGMHLGYLGFSRLNARAILGLMIPFPKPRGFWDYALFCVGTTDTDLYALSRIEKLVPGERVDITWKVIPKPQK